MPCNVEGLVSQEESMAEEQRFSRRDFVRMAGITLCSAALPGAALAGPPTSSPLQTKALPDAETALRLLTKGNARFVNLRLAKPEVVKERRDAVLLGEHPIAAILCCSDPRVVPETIFDEGLNDLFAVRVAGNSLSDQCLGSLEYSVKKLDLHLVMVLGHEDCGAVKGAVEMVRDGVDPEGHIGSLIRPLIPAVTRAQSMPGNWLENAVRENVKLTVQQLREADPIVTKYEKTNGLRVVGALYHLRSGVVELLDI